MLDLDRRSDRCMPRPATMLDTLGGLCKLKCSQRPLIHHGSGSLTEVSQTPGTTADLDVLDGHRMDSGLRKRTGKHALDRSH